MITIIFTCLILCFIGYLINKEIHTIEFICMCGLSVIISCIIFAITCIPIVNDTYYQSGRYQIVSWHPYFVEEYKQQHTESYACGTDDEGNTEYCTRTYYTTEHETHYPYYLVEDNLGQSQTIDKSQYDQIKKEFGNRLKVDKFIRYHHSQQKCVKGDPNLYYYNNETNSYKYPTTKLSQWYNPLKHKISLFNTEKKQVLLNYPKRQNWISNNRMLVKEKPFCSKDWDILNTQLYEKLKVNLILIQLDNIDKINQVKYDWNVGKKNDIIICYVGNYKNPEIVKVFGWYESEILSVKLESVLLENGINLKDIKQIVLSYYKPFDFSQFKYLTFKQPDRWQIVLTAIITLLIMIIFYVVFATNELNRY